MRLGLVFVLLAAAICGGCVRAVADYTETDSNGQHGPVPPPPQRISPEIQIANGVAKKTLDGADIAWTAWIYNVEGDLVFMEFRWGILRGDGTCGGGVGPFITSDPGTTWIIGSTGAAGAAWAKIHLEGKPSVLLDIVSIRINEGVGYYAASLEGGPFIRSVEVLDSSGTVLETKKSPQG